MINFASHYKYVLFNIFYLILFSFFFLGNMGTFTTILLFLFLFAIIGILLAISRKPQNRYDNAQFANCESVFKREVI